MRLPSILAHVLATSTLVACGGQTASIGGDPNGSSSSGSSGSSPAPTSTTTPTVPPPHDGGSLDAGFDSGFDAGCNPKLVKSEGTNCADIWQQPCGIPAGVKPEDGMSAEECALVCGVGKQKYWGCGWHALADVPGPAFDCYTCVEGRRPQGYVDPFLPPTAAGWLAHAADLERVSVDAFQILARELVAHGAPTSLALRAKQAELDEVQHTCILEGLAIRAGATLTRTTVEHRPVRPLVEIAIENAVEGCIRETYGALVASHQSEHATRFDVRTAMIRIARDETQHAELAWDLHAWLMGRLDRAERARVERAMELAIDALAIAARSPVGAELVGMLGLPSAHVAERLVAGLSAHLFQPALAA